VAVILRNAVAAPHTSGSVMFFDIGHDGRCDEWALQRIIAEMAKLAPMGWEFPADD
jgi:hypothetical protein